MSNVNAVKWKEFKLSELFEIKGSGKSKTKNEIKTGKYNYITTKGTNNGIDSKSDYYNNLANCLTIDSATDGICFFQDTSFVSSDHVEVLRLKNYKLNRSLALFFITILNQNMYLYSYGRKRSQSRLRNEIISVPVNNKGIPDWSLMENYIKERTERIIFKSKSNLKTYNLTLYSVKWKEFKISDIFVLKRGKRLKSIDRKLGKINYYSTSGFNNGLTDKISNPLFVEKNALIFTTFGYSYYVNNIFTASDEISILKIKNIELNNEIGLFLVTILNKLKYKFSFGRKAFLNRLENETILLPIDNKGIPNWKFMESYIKERTENIYF